MKIAAFLTSSSHHGNTATAVQTLLEGAKSAGAEVEIFYLNDYYIKPCIGCRVCEKTDKCIYGDTDDVHLFHDAIRTADAFVLGTQTFYGDIAGQFKMFVDRVYPFMCCTGKDPVTQQMTFGSILPDRKPGVMIAISGSHGVGVLESHVKVGYHCLNDINSYLWREVLIPYTTWTAVKDMTEKKEELFRTGVELVQHVKDGCHEDKAKTAALCEKFKYKDVKKIEY